MKAPVAVATAGFAQEATTARITTFAQLGEFEKARKRLDALSLPYEVISPGGYRLVGAPALVVSREGCAALAACGQSGCVCSGFVDYRPAQIRVPSEEPPRFAEDVFGHAAIMVLAPCVADTAKIRIVAHISGELAPVFPYLNAEMREGCYNRNGPTFTFMDGQRMVSLYPRRITVAKADEIADAWRTLETLRRRVNSVWGRRAEITPSDEMREKPPALEIFKRLPKTNCGACGEATCLAFAVRLWQGSALPGQCGPVFGGEHEHLKDALVEICRGLGVG